MKSYIGLYLFTFLRVRNHSVLPGCCSFLAANVAKVYLQRAPTIQTTRWSSPSGFDAQYQYQYQYSVPVRPRVEMPWFKR